MANVRYHVTEDKGIEARVVQVDALNIFVTYNHAADRFKKELGHVLYLELLRGLWLEDQAGRQLSFLIHLVEREVGEVEVNCFIPVVAIEDLIPGQVQVVYDFVEG